MSRFTLPCRLLAAAVLTVTSVTVVAPHGTPVQAAAPAISATPSTVPPHGVIDVSATGFDPSSTGHPTSVSFSLRTATGSIALATLNTDTAGAIHTQPITLPLTLAAGPTTLQAIETAKTGKSAVTALTVGALQAQVNNGQPLDAHPGDLQAVKGSGFAPDDTIKVLLNGVPLTGDNNQATFTSDAAGMVDVQVRIPPDAALGVQTLTVTGGATGAGQHDQASIPLNLSLTAPITGGGVQISPNPAAVGTALQASATGFQPGEPVTFTLHYYDIALSTQAIVNVAATADSAGSATATVPIPGSADASKGASVSATGITSGRTLSSALIFAVLARLAVTPPVAPPGSTITITGSGFVPGEALFATTRLFKPPVGRFAVIDATGHFTATATLLATLQPGQQYVLAVGGSAGDQASIMYTVSATAVPSLQITPGSAPAGGTVSVQGQGFGANETVNFSVNSAAIAPVKRIPLTDAQGTFSATVQLTPGTPPGTTALTATGATSGASASALITVTASNNHLWYFAEGFTGQGPTVFFHETITLFNPNAQSTRGTLRYSFPDGTGKTIGIALKAHTLAVRDVNRDVGANRIVSALVTTDRAIVAARTITRTDAKKRALDSDYSPGQPYPAQAWYFAEGYSGVTFQPYLTIANPNTVPVTATVTILPTSGKPKSVPVPLTASGRATVNLRSVLPGKSFSLTLVATAPVVAERVEYWGDGSGSAKFGAGVKPGVTTPGRSWYFGYGSVLGGDQAFISIANPMTTTAHISAQFYDGTGKKGASARITVGPGQRGTLTVGNLLGKNPHSPVADRLSSDVPVVAEEAQYSGGSPNIGSHAGASIEGRQATATRWSFAAGDTKTYTEREYIFNPSNTPVYVTGHFYGADGQQIAATYLAKPTSVITISANAIKGLHAGAHASVWTSIGKVAVVVDQVLAAPNGRAVLADQGLAG